MVESNAPVRVERKTKSLRMGNLPWDSIIEGLSTIANIWQQEKDRNWNSNEAQKNRDFQSSEAAAQRDWSSQEAERARDWNEEMYAKYNSLSGKIAQAEQAGVNPMFAVTGNAVTPMTTQAANPSGATAGSVGTPTAHFVDLVGSLMNLRESKARIDKMEQETEGQRITNETLSEMNRAEIMKRLSDIELNESNVALIMSKVLNTDADTALKNKDIERIAAQIVNINSDTDVKVKQIDVMLSEISKNATSIDVMEQQILSMAEGVRLSEKQRELISEQIDTLKQNYDHNEVMNEFKETIGRISEADAKFWDVDSYGYGLKAGVVRIIKEMRTLATFGKK